MSFISKNFTPVGGQGRAGNSPAHWSYKSVTDNLADIQVPGYFDEIGTQVSPDDFINVSLADSKVIITVASVTLNPPGVVIDPAVIFSSGVVTRLVGTSVDLVAADNLSLCLIENGASAFTVNVPDDATELFPQGAEMDFIRDGTGSVTFNPAGGVTIESRDGLVSLNAQFSAATLKKIGPDEWRLVGDLA